LRLPVDMLLARAHDRASSEGRWMDEQGAVALWRRGGAATLRQPAAGLTGAGGRCGGVAASVVVRPAGRGGPGLLVRPQAVATRNRCAATAWCVRRNRGGKKREGGGNGIGSLGFVPLCLWVCFNGLCWAIIDGPLFFSG
jgi:hypothetical protein